MVHKSNPCIAILSKPADKLALRTKSDVVGVAASLNDSENIPNVIYVSMNDLSKSFLDSNNDLCLGTNKISGKRVQFIFLLLLYIFLIL
jgi:hypothetical protein